MRDVNDFLQYKHSSLTSKRSDNFYNFKKIFTFPLKILLNQKNDVPLHPLTTS